jgi:predicted nucleic acid-binding protein
MVAEPVFVDTNILVHASRERSPFHARATSGLRRAGSDGSSLWISRQILREYVAVVTRPQPTEPALTATTAAADARGLLAKFNVAEDGSRVTDRLLQLLEQTSVGGKQVHDANIAATMLAHGIRRLLTFNVADFRRFAGLIELVAL